MNTNETVRAALVGAFWDCLASPYAMMLAVVKDTGNEGIPDERKRQIEKVINRAVMAKEPVDFKALTEEVAAVLPGDNEPHWLFKHLYNTDGTLKPGKMEAAHG